jgi:pimeloyl-ACP methyl ester carboxylesterase
MAQGWHGGVVSLATASLGNQFAIVQCPKTYQPNGTVRGIIWCHGAAATSGQVTVEPTAEYFSSLYPMIAMDMGQLANTVTWSFDAALQAMDAAFTYLTTTMGAKTGEIIVLSNSMGGAAAAAWINKHPTRVAAWFGMISACALSSIFANNSGSLAAGISAACDLAPQSTTPYSPTTTDATYGGTLQANRDGLYIATHTPTNLASIPQLQWYGGADTTANLTNGTVPVFGPISGVVSGSGTTYLDEIFNASPADLRYLCDMAGTHATTPEDLWGTLTSPGAGQAGAISFLQQYA